MVALKVNGGNEKYVDAADVIVTVNCRTKYKYTEDEIFKGLEDLYLKGWVNNSGDNGEIDEWWRIVPDKSY